MPKPMLTWYTKVSAKFLAVFFPNRLPRQTENFRICLNILLPTYLVPEFQRLQLWNSMPSCVCMYVFFFVFVFKKPLKYFPFYSPILLTLWFWYLKTHIQENKNKVVCTALLLNLSSKLPIKLQNSKKNHK